MRVFVAGATGAIGTQLVPRLVAAGHEVHGMTRSESKQAMLDELGAVPVVADALDPDQVAEAVARAKPEVIVHQLTAIGALDTRHFDRDFALTNLLRTKGGLSAVGRASREGTAVRGTGGSGLWRVCAHRWAGEERGGPARPDASDLDWTIFRPPSLTNKPARGLTASRSTATCPAASASRAQTSPPACSAPWKTQRPYTGTYAPPTNTTPRHQPVRTRCASGRSPSGCSRTAATPATGWESPRDHPPARHQQGRHSLMIVARARIRADRVPARVGWPRCRRLPRSLCAH
jgi:hypothetical protein